MVNTILKRCTSCNKEKSITEYHVNKERKDGHASRCKICLNEEAIEYRKEVLIYMEEVLLNYYGGELSCERCNTVSDWGRKFFQWHHIEPDKKETKISDLIRVKNVPKLLAELDKCRCLCPSCHVIEHLENWGVQGGIPNKSKWGKK